MFWDKNLVEFSSKRPERFQPATDGSRCRILKSNIRKSSGRPEKRQEGKFEGTRGARATMRTQHTESTEQDSFVFIEIRKPVESDLNSLLICYG